MSETLSTEEILHRMRAHVDRHPQPAQPPRNGQPVATGEVVAVSAPVFASLAPRAVGSRDFMPLRFEIDTAVEGTRQVGQINPRRAGLHNDAIQFCKKAMRRSLTWYTRPIHYFQAAVIRALQQVLANLQGQEESIRGLSEDVAKYQGSIDQLSRHVTQLTGDVGREIGDFRNSVASEIAQQHQKVDLLGKENAELQFEIGALQSQLRRDMAELRGLVADRSEMERRLAETASELRASQESTVSSAYAPVAMRLGDISDELGWMRGEIQRLRDELRQTKLEGRLKERDWRRFLHDLQTSPQAASPQVSQAMARARGAGEIDFDYFRFEEVYRGEEALIAQRQREYFELFKGRDNVVDIGCGRGEFLELMKANGILARGVELGTDQLLLCREKGLNVVQQNLFDFLESAPDGSLGGLFSAQVIEHLSADDQLRFVALAYRKTSPGSPVVFETINIQSVFALTRNFFLDPTHIRPVHPEFLKFAMESAKFRDVEIRYSSPMEEPRIPALPCAAPNADAAAFNRAIEGLNNLIWGYLDYAAIGWR